VKYGFGNSLLSLHEILQAKKEGQRYIATAEGWVDCQSSGLEGITDPSTINRLDSKKDRIKFSRMDLLRLKATATSPLRIIGKGEKAAFLQKLMDARPSSPLPALRGMTSTLRPYQRIGVEWILFLHENGLGGLLCDDMGLGKTHQIMAFMVFLKEHRRVKRPFLVVCPTTVLSHWDNKIREHAPALKTEFYYGGQRDLQSIIKGNHVLLTSYGILRRDIEELKQVRFSLAVFDEIQHIKNSQTLAHQAAREIDTSMKIGLTGTPIENALVELKALMDQMVPGYLGTDEYFLRRYVESDPSGVGGALSPRKEELSRLIGPFVLRRLKKTVLKELPQKIEDVRTCRLSEDQVRLYRDAIASRGKGLREELAKEGEPVPYMHIFALLNLLKQICDHPLLLNGKADGHEHYESGKWELFKELLAESLDSGQKVVIYSQYLGMIKIIEQYLRKLSTGFVTLTGANRNRGAIVSRFNDDPDCRVYVGSLKAGGMGIDLVAASVVIHYDRWWNAAKEDQATDRVHRIGQRRGVQVFKLVTEGTLEEKISAIIEKKKKLMESVVREDDPGLLKTFSREELIEMLSDPSD
jgi:SNF2 family DNA or RNA helicase